MTFTWLAIRAFSAAALIGSSACSTPTTVTDVWKDPTYAAGPMRKLLVFGANMGETNRRNIEDGFAYQLGQRGVVGVASYRVLPSRHPDREEIRAYLMREGFDGALFTVLRGVETTVRIAPSTGFDTYYGTWDGYAETDRYVNAETTLWDARSGKLVWSGVTRTENPSSGGDAAQSIVKKVVSELEDAKLVAPPKVAHSGT